MHARLEEILAEFETRGTSASSGGAVQQVLLEFNRAVAPAGRSDQVPMIDGAVLDAATWGEYAPKVEALRDRLQQRVYDFGRKRIAEQRAKQTATLRVFFPASLLRSDDEADEPVVVEDEALQRLCSGASDRTGLEDDPNLRFDDSPVLPLEVEAVVEFDEEQRKLFVVIPLAIERAPTDDEWQKIAAALRESMFHGWGLNYGFGLPAALEDHRVQFAAEPVRAQIVPFS